MGLLFAARGVGGLLAGVVLARVALRIGERRVPLVFLVASALCGLACVLCTNWALAALAVVGWGIADTVVVMSINAADRMLSFGIGAVGALVGGAVAEAFHTRVAITGAVLLIAVAAAVVWRSPAGTGDPDSSSPAPSEPAG